MNRERLQRIRNFQSQDFYPALVMRPITIAVMLVVADWKFLTPNRLTTAANLLKLAGAWLILEPAHWLWAALLLQLGLLFDHLDGTLARYRRTFTKLGSFYDKVSDIVLWGVVMMAAGWQVYEETGQGLYLLLASGSVIALNVCGYMKWLVHAETERVRWLEARRDPNRVIARQTAPIVIAPPPQRTPREWWVWFWSRFGRIWIFDEMDLWLWLGLALVIGRLDWGLWLMVVSQGVNMIVMFIKRTLQVMDADERIRELEAEHAGFATGPTGLVAEPARVVAEHRRAS
jgi:phosphatidylglycerophosphate synthase